MNNFTLIINDNLSPEFNLASEEYFLTQKSGAYILLWRNSRSVIIGRNQNAYAELDFDFVRNNNIKVIRRLTGGGAVFHDIGNQNFSFIFNGSGLSDFREYLSPVVAFLGSLGLNATFSGRNDILANGKKISGCAQTNSRGRTLIHGTLLFSADLSLLAGALKPNPLKLSSNGVASVRSRVGNIADMLAEELTVSEFRDKLSGFLADKYNCKAVYPDERDIAEIKALATEKYSSFEWNIGQSPSWSMEKTGRVSSGLITFALSVKDGIICEARIFGDFFSLNPVSAIETALKGCIFSPDAVFSVLENIASADTVPGLTPEKAVDIIFFRAQ